MRQYIEILRDIERSMVNQNLSKELEDMHNFQKRSTTDTEFCSATATWLYTFQIYASYDELLMCKIPHISPA
jgi:hypothetical protein